MGDNLCPLCLCEIAPKLPHSLPVCRACYEHLAKLPVSERMGICLEVTKNRCSNDVRASLELLVQNITDLIEASKRFSPYRLN